MFTKATEKGQALILITLAAIGLFAFAALAIDGSRVYSEKRNAQNAADAAALAGALAYTRNNSLNDSGIETVAQTRATSNGYDNGQLNDVAVSATAVPSGECPGGTDGKDITVNIVAYVDTTFARVLGRNQLTTAVTATSRACGFYQAPLFNGNAIVGLKPNDGGNCAIDTGNSNSKTWVLRGGGVFSNGCLEHPNGTLTIPNGKCITSVGVANVSGGGTHNCIQQNRGSSYAYDFPADVQAMMPPNPCTGTVSGGRYAGGGIIPTSGQTTFNNGVYCIADFDTLDAHIVLNNATLYVTDENFSSRFNGGGNTGFFGTASTSGVYKGYYLIVKLLSKSAADACQQYFDYRGNGNLQMVGTIFAPSTCVDYRGNSSGSSIHSQMIFYRFTSNGTADIDVDYQADENYQEPIDPTIAVLE